MVIYIYICKMIHGFVPMITNLGGDCLEVGCGGREGLFCKVLPVNYRA